MIVKVIIMLERIENKWGNIDIERPVVAKIIKEVVIKHKEVFGITNSKGHMSSFLSKFTFDKDADFIKIKKEKDGGIHININLILYFGESISLVTKSIIDESRKELKEILDLEPGSITIHIVGLKIGMKSKKVIKRNIEVKG